MPNTNTFSASGSGPKGPTGPGQQTLLDPEMEASLAALGELDVSLSGASKATRAAKQGADATAGIDPQLAAMFIQTGQAVANQLFGGKKQSQVAKGNSPQGMREFPVEDLGLQLLAQMGLV